MAGHQMNFAVKELFPALARTTTANGTGVDLQLTVNADDSNIKAFVSVGAASGTTPTLDIKMQESDDNSSWSDISGATFTQKVTTGYEEIHFRTVKRYTRAVATIAGDTPSFTFMVGLLTENRYS